MRGLGRGEEALELEATLPWPPSTNHYWAARGKSRYLWVLVRVEEL